MRKAKGLQRCRCRLESKAWRVGLLRAAQAGKVMIRVRQATGRDVPTAQLFRTPTIAGLAEALERCAGGGAADSQAISRAGYAPEQRAAGVPCSANQEQMLVLHQMAPASAGYNMAEPVRLRGALDEAALEVWSMDGYPSSHGQVDARECCRRLQVANHATDAHCWRTYMISAGAQGVWCMHKIKCKHPAGACMQSVAGT